MAQKMQENNVCFEKLIHHIYEFVFQAIEEEKIANCIFFPRIAEEKIANCYLLLEIAEEKIANLVKIRNL